MSATRLAGLQEIYADVTGENAERQYWLDSDESRRRRNLCGGRDGRGYRCGYNLGIGVRERIDVLGGVGIFTAWQSSPNTLGSS
jgi:hypothetical protein